MYPNLEHISCARKVSRELYQFFFITSHRPTPNKSCTEHFTKNKDESQIKTAERVNGH